METTVQNPITQFANETLGVNIRVIDFDGEPWFVARDILSALGYHPKKITQSLTAHCKGVTKTVTQTPAGPREVKIIPEADLYRLILRSKKPEAEAFSDWVTEEVLPSIRKHGGYLTPSKLAECQNDPEAFGRLVTELIRAEIERDRLKRRDAIFGNITPFGQISSQTGKPRVKPVRGYLRSTQKTTTVTEYQLELF